MGWQGLIGLLVKLATGSTVAFRTLFELNISSIIKDMLSTYDLAHGMQSTPMVDGHQSQVGYSLSLKHTHTLTQQLRHTKLNTKMDILQDVLID